MTLEKSWDPKEFASKDAIFNFFKKYNYNCGEDLPVLAKDVFKSKQIIDKIKKLYLLVDEEDYFQIWLIEAPNAANLKSWRSIVANEAKGRIFDLLIIFTEDYSKFYFISIIGDDIIQNIDVFDPNNPSPECDRLIENLANRKPIIDSSGLSATIAQARHELYAEKLLKYIKSGKTDAIKLLLKNVGLPSHKKLMFFLPRENAPLKKTIIDIILEGDIISIIKDKLSTYIAEYLDLTKENLEYIIILHSSGIYIFDTFGKNYYIIDEQDKNKIINKIPFKEDESTLKVLTSFIASFDTKTAFNSKTFEAQFGPYSPFFCISQTLINEHFNEKKQELEVIWHEWLRHFGKAYHSGDPDEVLFLKHTYLSMLIKVVLYTKYFPEKEIIDIGSFEELAKRFEEKEIALFFNDFYSWAINISPFVNLIFESLRNSKYETDDIFRVIYQDMVSPSTRHALGEFYTPPELARLMIDHVYKIGQIVLDPACGSGTFLVEIISKIKESGIPINEQINAINNIYGIDVNPIAVSVAKANLLLHCEDLFNKGIKINVFLADSLFSIEKNYQEDLDLGICEIIILGDKKEKISKKNKKKIITGTMGTIKLPIKLLSSDLKKNYQQEFLTILRFLDSFIGQNYDWEFIVKEFNSKFNNNTYSWLQETVSTHTSITFKRHILNIGKTCFDLAQKKQDHIWFYLLYNSLGIMALKNKVDLIIGNPPWIVLNGLYSNEYKEKIKNLANVYYIMKGGHLATHTEITSLFFYRCAESFLKNEGLIFFVTTAGLMTGDQHSKFRLFRNFGDIFIWQFDEDIFRIHNICIGMKKKKQSLKEKLKIPVITYRQVKEKDKNKILFIKQDESIYVPYNYDEIHQMADDPKKIEKYEAKRLVPTAQLSKLLPRNKSPYHKLFFQGATIVPRNLLFINIIKELDEFQVKISPLKGIQQKEPWTFKAFDSAIIEKEYIFDVAKSTELIPFHLLRTFKVFLPIEKEDFLYHPDKIKPNAKKHFEKLNYLYKKYQKKGASISDLWKRIDYQKGLSTSLQKGKIKVVFPAIGSMIKSAIIKEKDTHVIIDTSLYYYSAPSIEEAYYLIGILNSKSISNDLKFRGSTGAGGSLRNLHKMPLNYPLPKYNSENLLHQEIVQQSKKMELFSKKIIDDWIEQEKYKVRKKLKKSDEQDFDNIEVKIRPRTIQNLILKKLDDEFNKLDELILKLIYNNTSKSNLEGYVNEEDNR